MLKHSLSQADTLGLECELHLSSLLHVYGGGVTHGLSFFTKHLYPGPYGPYNRPKKEAEAAFPS